ncbi:MAG TPA: indolepyruvate ferredoxin oxidoreductase subunit alpha [Tissierellia bacterium]|nr:indolepyruvate ferredoxin oxidoreductase subunit alpha [Tissierellia bacterium]
MKYLMSGNEAVARALYEAGVTFASAYPGTPSTEILESLVPYHEDMYVEWAPNEKVALEAAVGASMAGFRAVAAMKHVGLNVAADPLMTVSYTGVNGGLVIVSADDPGMHSSQNEQDNRLYARLAKIPCVEISGAREAAAAIKEAYQISESFDTPVLFRMTTRVCHSKELVEEGERVAFDPITYEKHPTKFIAAPANARKRRPLVEERVQKLVAYSETSALNTIEDNGASVGVIASGVSVHYAKEVFDEKANYLTIGLTYPLPMEKIRSFVQSVETCYVIEELEPFIEEQIRLAGIDVIGKEKIPTMGELNVDILREALFGETPTYQQAPEEFLVARPPILCSGCPHRGFFYEAKKFRDMIVTGDIGCYTLGATPPLQVSDSVVCMGASISMAHGVYASMAKNGEKKRVMAVIGDSTFLHSGMTSLLNSVYNKTPTINVILDNRITAMTGHQENPGTGYNILGEPAAEVDFEKVVRALGIEKVLTINPLKLGSVREAIKECLAFDEGPSVIITRWPCALKRYSDQDHQEFNLRLPKSQVIEDLCRGCRNCVRTGCPSIRFNKETKKASVDEITCVGCGVCRESCPFDAIVEGELR